MSTTGLPGPGFRPAPARARGTGLLAGTRGLTDYLGGGGWAWNLRMIDAPGAWGHTHGDPAYPIAIVDTGLDPDHPDLRGKVIPGMDVVSPGAGWMDDLGHGTAVAGLAASRGWRRPGLAGVAPAARLIPIKCNIHGTGHVRAEHIAAGVRAAQRLGARVINLSVGVVEGEEFLGQMALDDMATAILEALAAGIVVVCAAGPAGPATPWPGAWSQQPGFEGLIAVGGLNRQGRVAHGSAAGAFVNVFAPAEGVMSTALGKQYAPFGGTSAAAPHVAGLAALLLAMRPDAEPERIRSWIIAGAYDGHIHAARSMSFAIRSQA